jgi:sulfoxide reductase heme-binding subunit YedZ
MHLLTYVIADRFAGLDFPDGMLALSTARNLARSVGEDIYKRPFITIGFAAWTSMAPLAITSTTGWIRRLGGKRWNRLHRLVYLTGILGPLHYFWLVKADIRRPLLYASIVAALLGTRVFLARVRRPALSPSARRM